MNTNRRELKIEGKALETSKPSAYNRNILIYIRVHSWFNRGIYGKETEN
jgi:hypothetical protein